MGNEEEALYGDVQGTGKREQEDAIWRWCNLSSSNQHPEDAGLK